MAVMLRSLQEFFDEAAAFEMAFVDTPLQDSPTSG